MLEYNLRLQNQHLENKLKTIEEFRTGYENFHDRKGRTQFPSTVPNIDLASMANYFHGLSMSSTANKMTLKDLKIESFNIKADYTVTAFFQQFGRAALALNFMESQKINALPNFMPEFPRRVFESPWTVNHQRA